MTSWTDPFHPLIVVTRHHHDTPGCPGHAEPDECTEPRTTNILEHPDDCRDLHSAAFPYRCMTQQDVELGETEVPVDTGVYRVRATGSGHGDDADRGFDVETVTPTAARAAWLALATAPEPDYRAAWQAARGQHAAAPGSERDAEQGDAVPSEADLTGSDLRTLLDENERLTEQLRLLQDRAGNTIAALTDENGRLRAEIKSWMASADNAGPTIEEISRRRGAAQDRARAAEAERDALTASNDRLTDLFERLHSASFLLDFDAGECAPPQTQDAWCRLADEFLVRTRGIYAQYCAETGPEQGATSPECIAALGQSPAGRGSTDADRSAQR